MSYLSDEASTLAAAAHRRARYTMLNLNRQCLISFRCYLRFGQSRRIERLESIPDGLKALNGWELAALVLPDM